MRSLNFCTVSGTLSGDPVEDRTQRVGPIVHLLIAVNDGGPAEQANRVLTVPVLVFGKRATRCLERLESGSRLVVHGRLIQGDPNGQQLALFSDWIEFCGASKQWSGHVEGNAIDD